MKKIKSKNRKNNKLNKRAIVICLICATLVAIGVIVAVICLGGSDNVDSETTAAGTEYKSEAIDKSFESISLGSGIRLISLAEVSANYPEDGSDVYTENVLSATFVNESTEMLQYAVIEVNISGEKFTFDISSIPAGEKVIALENNKRSAPEKIENISCRASNIVFFESAPSKMSDKLSITFQNGMVTIHNVSEEDLTGNISIYYKNKMDDAYFGGITYRINISDLDAGEKIKGASSHADSDDSVLMFVQYVP